VGEIAERLIASSNHPKKYPCYEMVSGLACLKKERDKKKRKIEKRGREREREERKEEGKSEREPWLHTLKQLMHTNYQDAAPLPFQAFAAPFRLALAHMHEGGRTLCSQS
jgi:hypothetical protein